MKPTTSSRLAVVTILILLAPVNALYGAWIFDSIWNLLVRPQYGTGPSYESWYGFSLLFSLAIIPLSTKGTSADENTPAINSLVKYVVNMLLALTILGIAHAVHAVLGWS